MKVGLVDLVHQYRSIQPEIDSAIREVLDSGQFVLGRQVSSLEEEIADYCGAKHAVAVNSGTDAILLALVAQGIGPGDEVVTSPFTFVATVEAICLAGATPVLADIDPATFNLCPVKVAEAITPRTRALMPVDLFGQMADRSAFIGLAEKYHLKLVWDSAQAIGALFDGRPLGAYPGCSTLSFFPTKNLGAYGDGGMVLTDDPDVRDRLIQYRFHGSGGGYVHTRVGYCSRLDALQAAILRAKLPRLCCWTEMRRKHADSYARLLADSGSRLPFTDSRAHHIFHQYTIRHTHRDQLKRFLKDNEVDSGIYYPLALHLQEAYTGLGGKPGDFPEAERATAEVLSIPIHPDLSEEQIEYVASLIRQFESREQ